jgi:hypothetical protein
MVTLQIRGREKGRYCLLKAKYNHSATNLGAERVIKRRCGLLSAFYPRQLYERLYLALASALKPG